MSERAGDNTIKTVAEFSGLRALVCVAGLLPGPSALAAGSDGDASIDNVVVTATRLPTGVSSASVTVFESADIDARNPTGIVDLLRHAAGVNVSQQGGRGGVTNVLVRGGESNFTAVFIDGVRVNDPLNTSGGSYGFAGLDLFVVSRVEIIRGPMSSLYGSDAMAGVIAISTARETEGAALEVHGGMNDFAFAGLQFTAQPGTTTVSANVHARHDDGDDSSYEDRGLSASLQGRLGDGSRYSLGVRKQHASTSGFPQESGGPRLAVLREREFVEADETHVRGAWTSRPGKSWRLRLSASRYERDEHAVSPGIAAGILDGVPPTTVDNRFDRDQLLATLSRQLASETSLLFGGEWQSEDGTSKGTLDIGFPLPTDFELDRDSRGLFAELSTRIGALDLQGSIRHDDIDAVGQSTSKRLGVSVDLHGQWALHLNAGEGFKAPSFFALAHPLVGNTALRPERADTFDIRLARRSPNAGFELGLFRSNYEDLVDFDPQEFRLVNRARVVTEGAESSLTWQPADDVQLRAQLSYLRADIRGSDARLRNRPRWRGGITVEWSPFVDWQVLASALYVDAFYDSSIATGMLQLDAYERIDVTASWQATDRMTWRFSVDNLLDARYEEAVGFPAAGTRARMGIRYEF